MWTIKIGLVLLSVFLTHKNKILAHEKKNFSIIIFFLFKRENRIKSIGKMCKELLCATGDRIYGAWEEIKPFSVSSLLTDPGSWILAVRFFLLSLWGQKLPKIGFINRVGFTGKMLSFFIFFKSQFWFRHNLNAKLN